MFKNKFTFPFLLGTFLLVGNIHAQTIDDLSSSLRNPAVIQAPNLPTPGAMPTINPGDSKSSPSIRGTYLAGIFLSSGASQAEFEIDGKASYFGIGDRLKDGWIIEKIETQSVELKKCTSSKNCSRKIILFSGAS